MSDNYAIRSALSVALDKIATGSLLHSEKIDAILSAIAPLIRAEERERAAAIVEANREICSQRAQHLPDGAERRIVEAMDECLAGIRDLILDPAARAGGADA